MTDFDEKFGELGKKLDAMFKPFDGIIEKFTDRRGSRTILSHNGHAILKGPFKSLTINGYRIKIKKSILNGEKAAFQDEEL